MSASDTVVDTARDARTDELAAAWLGQTLEERYRLIDVLGSGGFAVVFRATHLTLGRDVAVKILQPQRADEKVLARFEREAAVLARLAHPGIVAATDYGVSGATPFLVMELIEGRTLRAILDEGPLPVERAIVVTRQILRALAYAHGQGVLHRDLKPGNVVISTPDGAAEDDVEPVVKVLDFGLAKLVRAEGKGAKSITAEGVAFGTPGYVSPEVLSGRPADARSDVYAVGVMLFEMLVGRRPHGGRSRGEELRLTVTTRAPPSIAELAPALPCVAELDALLSLALARSPSERFADANAMLAVLDHFVAFRRRVGGLTPPEPPLRHRDRSLRCASLPARDQIDPHAAPRVRVPAASSRPATQRWQDARVPLPLVLVAVAIPTCIALVLAVIVLALLAA